MCGGLLSLVLSISACTTTQAPPTDWAWRTDLLAPSASALPSASGLLDGIDEPVVGGKLGIGDAVLFGLHLVHGTSVRTWFVRIASNEAEADIKDGLSLRVTVFDEREQLVASEDVTVLKHLVHGVTHACRTVPARKGAPTGLPFGTATDEHRAMFAVMDVLRVVQQTDALADVLWQALRRPSLFSLLGGVRVSAGMSFEHATSCTDPATGHAAYEFPMRILVNKAVGLRCMLTAVDPDPPFRVCGGITRLVGRDPEDPTRSCVLRLLAARCAHPKTKTRDPVDHRAP
ncbi:MAG: hypothetical protein KDC95_01905 [Planctomycetes bacterium]|nr:hypothetical protein [Planctomycetota bacterium]